MLCPLCGTDSGELLLESRQVPARHIRQRGDLTQAGDYGDLCITACRNCGHVYNAAFDPGATEHLYEVHPSTNAPVHASMLRGLQSIAHDILGRRTDRPRILEIGCGVGALARLLARNADCVHLIEPNLSLDGGGIGEDKLLHLPGFFPEASTGEKYDLVVCRQVLEHVDDPVSFLTAILDHLAPNGQAYIEVPSMDYIAANASPADFHYLHVQYFTRATMENLFARAGFEIIRLTSIKGGHDFGFLVKATGPSQRRANSHGIPDIPDLKRRLYALREAGKARLDGCGGRIALYGACAYSQALLGLYPDFQPDAVFDDTESYAGHEIYWQGRAAPVESPTPERVAEIDNVVISAYLHDRTIAQRLASLGFTGNLFTLRTDPACGHDGVPPSLFL